MSDPSGKSPERRSQIVLYKAEDGRNRIQVRMEAGTVWLTQRLLADLNQVVVNTVNYHIKAIYRDRELSPEATIRKYRILQTEGGRQVDRLVEHYNQDKFLRDTELPVLEGSGSVSREDAIAWAEAQYGAFVERRRLEAEQGAEARYLDDLRSTAAAFERGRKKPSARLPLSKTRGKRKRSKEGHP